MDLCSTLNTWFIIYVIYCIHDLYSIINFFFFSIQFLEVYPYNDVPGWYQTVPTSNLKLPHSFDAFNMCLDCKTFFEHVWTDRKQKQNKSPAIRVKQY